MVEKSANEISVNLPFRLKVQIELSHKVAFLYFINDLEEVAAELKKLTPACRKVFGNFPNHLISGKFDDYGKLWSDISYIVSNSVWFETGLDDDYSAWSRIIGEKNPKYKNTHNIYEKFVRAVFKVTNETVDGLFNGENINYSDSNSDKLQEIKRSDFKFEFSKLLRQELKKDYEFLTEIEKTRTAKLKELKSFQKKFDNVITKFYLKKQWLADAVFLAIWDGTGKLKTHNIYTEDLDVKLLSEIEEQLRRTPNDEDEFEKIIRLRGNIPLPNPFLFDESLSLLSDFNNYEERAVKAYRQYIHEYIELVKKKFKKHGYKGLRGDKYDYRKVQRLVIWNISDFECLWEVIQHIPEFQEVDVNDYKEANKCIWKLRKSFDEYKKYDLPVRPYGLEVIRLKKQP